MKGWEGFRFRTVELAFDYRGVKFFVYDVYISIQTIIVVVFKN